MTRKCAASGCNNSQKNKSISLHQFPKDLKLRNSWIFAMKREGFQPNSSSCVCSVHFKAEDFEVGNKSHKKRVHTFLKKNAVPSVFTTATGLPPYQQAQEEKQRTVLKRLNPVPNVMPRFPPVCLSDGNPCCEREAWENIPIVSNMCQKCALSCGENEGIGERKNKRKRCNATISTFTPEKGIIEAEDVPNVHTTLLHSQNQITNEKSVSVQATSATTNAAVQVVPGQKNASLQTDLKQSDMAALLKRIQFLEAKNKEHVERQKADKKMKQKLKNKVNYLLRKNAKLLMLISDMRKKELLSKQAALVLSDKFSDIDLDLIKGLVKDRKKGQKYTKNMRDFSVTLFYYSPRAYKYVAKLFFLPHVSTIRKWLGKVDAYPGISTKCHSIDSILQKKSHFSHSCRHREPSIRAP